MLFTTWGARSHLPVGGLEEFGNLVPVDGIGMVELHGEPAAVTVVRRGSESSVLKESIKLERVGNEVQ